MPTITNHVDGTLRKWCIRYADQFQGFEVTTAGLITYTDEGGRHRVGFVHETHNIIDIHAHWWAEVESGIMQIAGQYEADSDQFVTIRRLTEV